MSEYEMELTVEGTDVDEMAHVNNAVYLEYVERVARAHAESVGLDFQGCRDLGGVFVVRRHDVVYHLPCHVGDRLTLRTRVGVMKGARAARHVEIWRGPDRIVDCETEWVWIDPISSRPQRLPQEIPARFGL